MILCWGSAKALFHRFFQACPTIARPGPADTNDNHRVTGPCLTKPSLLQETLYAFLLGKLRPFQQV